MKNEIILWLSSLAILFLLGYVISVTDADYPITGTFGIEGKKVSYKLDKVCYEEKSYKNLIISDIEGIEARIILKNRNEQEEIAYKKIERGLECEIPKLVAGTRINYKVLIKYQDKIFEFPQKDFVTLTFWGHIPSPVKILFSILLYSGLLLTIRSLLELFNYNRNLKKYAIIGCTLYITLNTIVYPLYGTYKLGALNHFVPPIGDLVNPFLLIILLLWIAGTILIFNKIYVRVVTIIISFGTIALFYFI